MNIVQLQRIVPLFCLILTSMLAPAAANAYVYASSAVSSSPGNQVPTDYSDSPDIHNLVSSSARSFGSAIDHWGDNAISTYAGASASSSATYGRLGAYADSSVEVLFGLLPWSAVVFYTDTHPSGSSASAQSGFEDSIVFHSTNEVRSAMGRFGVALYSTLDSNNLDVGQECSDNDEWTDRLPQAFSEAVIGSQSITVHASPCRRSDSVVWSPFEIPLDTPVNVSVTLAVAAYSDFFNPYVTGFGQDIHDTFFVAGTANASHTALFALDLPNGITYTSANGAIYGNSLVDTDISNVPEPSTLVLLFAGISLIAQQRRRDRPTNTSTM